MEKRRAKAYNDMTVGPEWKCVLLFAFPLMLGQLLQQLYSTVDGIVVGNFVSSGALAAVGSCSAFTFVYVAFSFGMSNGSGILIAQLFGAGRRDELRSAAANIMLLLSGLAVVMMVIGVGFTGFITRTILGVKDPDICEQSIVYLRIYSVGMLFSFIYNGVSAILRGVGDSKALLYFLMVSTIMNTVLDVLFVGAMGMGVAGAAWATVISQLACVVVSIWYMFRNYPDFRFRSLKELKYDREKMGLCLKLGIPTTVQQFVVSCGNLALQRLVNSFGENTMAAVTVGSRFEHYTAIPSLALMQSISSFSGQNAGAGKFDRVKKGLGSTMIMDLISVSAICAAMYIFAPQLGRMFGLKDEALRQVVMFMHTLSLGYPIFALYFPMNGMFQGCGYPSAATVVALTALVGRVGAAYLLVYAFDVGYTACWQTYIIGWTLGLAVAAVYYFQGNWRKTAVVRRRQHAEENT